MLGFVLTGLYNNLMIILLIIGFALSVLLTAMSISLRSLSLPQLRYWARKGDEVSKQLYPLKARGSAVYLTIELIRSLSISGTLVILSSLLGGFLAWLFGSVILFVAFIVLSELYLKPVGTWLLANLSQALLGLAYFLKFMMLPLGRVFDRFIAEEPVTVTRSELAQIINSVQVANTDLSSEELRIVRHSLSFGDKTVADIMTPRSVINGVQADDVISPVLLDELHKSGHSRFPVFNTAKDAVVGILYIKDLFEIRKHTLVSDVMHKPVNYVNQERELDHVLQAFIKTKQHLFVVVNSFAEITGLITIEDIVEQVLGRPIIDEFDKYDSMRDVAEARAKVVKKQVKMVE